MKIAHTLIQLKQVVMTSSGTCLFLGNDSKVFIIYVDSIMGEQLQIAFQKKPQSRPLTKDFIRYLLCGFDIAIRNIILYHADKGVFFAKIIFHQNGMYHRVLELDIRPSDAILLSLTMNKPIMINTSLLDALSDARDLLENISNNKGNK